MSDLGRRPWNGSRRYNRGRMAGPEFAFGPFYCDAIQRLLFGGPEMVAAFHRSGVANIRNWPIFNWRARPPSWIFWKQCGCVEQLFGLAEGGRGRYLTAKPGRRLG